MRVKLKSSKSYPNEFLNQDNSEKHDDKHPSKHLSKDTLSANHDECDNSSSGVSSDQEVTASNARTIAKTSNNTNMIINTNPVESKHGILKSSVTNKNPVTNAPTSTIVSNVKIVETKKSINLPPLSNVTKKISAAVSEATHNSNDDFDDFDELPAKGFQRQISLTRKQAATIAMNRSLNTRSAVSLVQLPPPIEGDSDDPDHHQLELRKNILKVNKRIYLKPNVQMFCVCNTCDLQQEKKI